MDEAGQAYAVSDPIAGQMQATAQLHRDDPMQTFDSLGRLPASLRPSPVAMWFNLEKLMLQSWRWFGPNDPVSLREIRQAGVTDVVSSLHHIACGEDWPEKDIRERVHTIAWDEERRQPSGLRWGMVESLDPQTFLRLLQRYRHIDAEQLRSNLYDFLNAIMPDCEAAGVRMCIHPDDPAYPVFGIPRILSRAEDVERLFKAVPSLHSGLTLCTGSFGSCIHNDPAHMLEQFAERVYFVHFRNVTHVPGKEGSFYESNYLFGSIDMPRAMKALIVEE